MCIFIYPNEEAVEGYFLTKISIPVNYKRYKESLGDSLSLDIPSMYNLKSEFGCPV